MIRGLDHHVFRVPVRAGKIVQVLDHGQRLIVAGREGHRVEVALSRGLARLKTPKVGDVLVEHESGHIDVMSPEAFALKQLTGGADVQ